MIYGQKYIFEFVYNLLAMNIHLGLIHGDLHLNNGTIHTLFNNAMLKKHDITEKDSENMYMGYVLKPDEYSPDEVMFAFPSKFYFLVLD